ncbi:MAG: transcription antitermination factor NusB [Pseudomonadota bacterium]
MSEPSSPSPSSAELIEQAIPPVHPRRAARECVAQGLYQWLMTGENGATIRLQLLERTKLQRIKMDQEFFMALWNGVMQHTASLQSILETWLDRPWSEISYVERAVMLLGAYELVHCPDVPLKVVINEALEVNKAFGGSDGHRYVNSILDKCAIAHRKVGL